MFGFLRSSERDDLKKWLGGLSRTGDVYHLSQNKSYMHSEQDYDLQYGHADQNFIEETIGSFLINSLPRVPDTVLEVACGTGLLTGSLLFDGRIKSLIASDASVEFLRLTGNKTRNLPTYNRLRLLCLKDEDFGAIPSGVFDAIMMRSALHHFVSFKDVASTLISKLKPGGSFCMLEPRADFQIATSLILKNAKAVSALRNLPWSDQHDWHVKQFTDMTEFYLDRQQDKAAAEDKYSFHFEEFIEIAETTGTTLRCVGGEYLSTFSSAFASFLRYCMSIDEAIVADFVKASAEELAFMDRVYASRPRYGAAEWFVFQKP